MTGLFVVQKALFRKRWHVYMIGHFEGDYIWLATFRHQMAAEEWISGSANYALLSQVEADRAKAMPGR